MTKRRVRARTEYTAWSDLVKGEKDNHDRAVRFDVTDGFVGITAFEPDLDRPQTHGRVLLSPKQVTALRVFLAGKKRR